jgi:PTS system arbutin-like IIC component
MKSIAQKFKEFSHVIVDPVLYLAVVGIVLAISTIFSLTGSTFLKDIGTVLNAATNSAIIGNLPVILCIGICAGFAKKQKANASVFALMTYLMFLYSNNAFLSITGKLVESGAAGMGLYATGQAMVLGVQVTDVNVFGGIIIGCLAAYVWNKAIEIKIPEYLKIYGGPRMALLIMIPVIIIFAILMAYVWPYIAAVINAMSQGIQNAGGFGVFIYGFLNRFLIPTGLHHFLWMPFCYTPLGGTATIAGTTVYGATNIFYAEMPLIANGTLTTLDSSIRFAHFGFAKEFCALGVALAFIRASKPKNRKAVTAMMIPMYITVALAGITEPLDFTILFASPVLWLAKGILTGLSEMVLYLLHNQVYNIFGLIELFSVNLALPNSVTHFTTYLLVGVVFIVLTYFVFVFLIKTFNYMTPGRADDWGTEEVNSETAEGSEISKNNNANSNKKNLLTDASVENIIEGLGGADNIDNMGHCMTRLRTTVKDSSKINDELLKHTQSKGMFKNGKEVQLVYGLNVTDIFEQMASILHIED